MLNLKNFKFILASASPRRKELIGHLQLPFTILTADIDEASSHTGPDLFALDIATQKGQAIVETLDKQENRFIVAADTVVSLEGKIFGKPKNEGEARDYLSQLSGKEHSVFTGVMMFIIVDGEIFQQGFVEETRVTFNNISDELMERYLVTKDSLDKAGAYGIQGPSLTFISRVEGDYANVVGFPLSRFVNEAQVFFNAHIEKKDMWLNYF